MSKKYLSLKEDYSLTAFVAGFLVVLVGMTSSAILVFQAARAFGQSAEQASSWLGSLCLLMGVLTVVLSLRFKSPIVYAWSTAGAVLVTASSSHLPLSQAIGAFIFSSILIFISGVSGYFEKIMNRIPLSLASALLAGILIRFALEAFASFKTQPLLIGMMFLSYLLSRKLIPKLTMMFVLVMGTLVSVSLGLLHFNDVQVKLTEFTFVVPDFTASAILSLGFPLFIVTMASQNLTGLSVLKTYGFRTPVSPLITWSGLANLIAAPFGGFTINLAAITAAIAIGPESHSDPKKRYVSAVISGAFYILIGLCAGTVTSLFAAFPPEMIIGIAGFALLGTISTSLYKALSEEKEREAAFITFAMTASGLTILGIGSAFWGILVGALTQFLMSRAGKKSPL